MYQVDSSGLPFVGITVTAENIASFMDLDQYEQSTNRVIEEIADVYTVYSRDETTVGGREAIISRWYAGGLGYEMEQYDMMLKNGNVGWIVGCTSAFVVPMTDELLETCESILRSFRVLD